MQLPLQQPHPRQGTSRHFNHLKPYLQNTIRNTTINTTKAKGITKQARAENVKGDQADYFINIFNHFLRSKQTEPTTKDIGLEIEYIYVYMYIDKQRKREKREMSLTKCVANDQFNWPEKGRTGGSNPPCK